MQAWHKESARQLGEKHAASRAQGSKAPYPAVTPALPRACIYQQGSTKLLAARSLCVALPTPIPSLSRGLTDWWVFAVTIFTASGSQMTRSLSEPTAILPFRGYRLKIFAALVLVTATNWFSSIFPVACSDTERTKHPFGEGKRKSPGLALDRPKAGAMLTYHGYSPCGSCFSCSSLVQLTSRKQTCHWALSPAGARTQCCPSSLPTRCWAGSYHCFVPDDRHPFLDAIGPLWDRCEVVFSNCFLRSAERAVGTS